MEVVNRLSGGDIAGEGDFVLPYAAVRFEQVRDVSETRGELKVTYGSGDANRAELDKLGRLGAANDWWMISGDLSYSVFLEPLLFPDSFRLGEAGNHGTMANEVFIAVRGQWAIDRRLIPQEEQTMGGFFTVRGYPESVLASDSAFLATAEYRYHVGRGLRPVSERDNIRPWRLGNMRPLRPYSRPDWDLILRGFVDVGEAVYTDPISSESNSTLVGAGLGMELQVKENFVLRLDWGMALNDLDQPERVRAGDSRLHVMAMFLY